MKIKVASSVLRRESFAEDCWLRWNQWTPFYTSETAGHQRLLLGLSICLAGKSRGEERDEMYFEGRSKGCPERTCFSSEKSRRQHHCAIACAIDAQKQKKEKNGLDEQGIPEKIKSIKLVAPS